MMLIHRGTVWITRNFRQLVGRNTRN